MSTGYSSGPGRGGYRPGQGPPRREDRGRPPDPPERSLADIWPRYLEGGYFDGQGNLKIEYVSRERVEPLAREMCEAHPALTAHQVRRFFGHCRAIETKLRSGGSSWEKVRSEVFTLDRAAADGFGKQPKKIPEIFHEFIKRNVAEIQSEKDFLRGFLPHFEAVIGFGQPIARERN